MALYSRSKLVFNAISRYYTSQIHQTSVTKLVSSFSSTIANTNPQLHRCGSSSRCYHVDLRQSGRRWIDNSNNVWIATLIGSGIGVTIWFGHVETIPYTNRKHVVLISSNVERMIGEYVFKKTKARFKGKVLSNTNRDSVRVRLIGKDIIEALHKGLKEEMKTEGVKLAISHLEGLKWEILVVNDRAVNAFCLPGGKIVVFTGLLEHFRTDEEIATIIGHEVGHIVARHLAEKTTKILWFTIGELIMQEYVKPDLANKLSDYLLNLPFSRRMEIEADYIGLLLMAYAGYDPRVAPKVFKKLTQVSGDLPFQDYLSTHPSGKKRSKLLSQASVMKQAMSIYREAIARRQADT